MQKVLRVIYKIVRSSLLSVYTAFSYIVTLVKFFLNGIQFHFDFKSMGIPVINANLNGTCRFGKNLTLHNGKYFNMIGRPQPCYFIIGKNALLEIGDHVGISATAIFCTVRIQIGDHVKIGGNVVIYDTDFHSLNPLERNHIPENLNSLQAKPVLIKKGVFIGAHSIILKGVTLGENAVIGAGSVVTRDVPSNEVWAGNPAKFIKRISN